MSPEPHTILHNFSLSGPQRTAVLARQADVAVTAGAGTGKTRTLVARYLALLADGLPLRQIVAITFTRKAAREMRNRVRQEVGKYLAVPDLPPEVSEQWQAYYNELDAARIGTIHNLCGEILRAHPAEAGIDPRFGVLDETQAALLMQETVEAVLAWAVQAEGLLPVFELLRERPLQELVSFLLSHRLPLAAAISQIEPQAVLAHWQNQLAAAQAEELAQFLADAACQQAVRTLQMNQADRQDDKAEQQRLLALTAFHGPEAESLAGRLRNLAILSTIDLRGGSVGNWSGDKEKLREVKEALRCVRDAYKERPILQQSLNAQDEAIAAAMPAIYRLCQQAWHIYQSRKAEREALDFDDLEALAIDLLHKHGSIRTYWQEQIQALLVDEFQDTNEQQRRFIRLLCPDAGKLFIVGDAKQSIYRFRGADVTVFATEKERIAQDKGQLIDLDTSYRAHEALLAGMNYLLQPVLGEEGPQRPAWVAPFARLEPGTKAAAYDLLSPYIEFHLTVGTKPEALPRAATAVAARLAQLHMSHNLDYGGMAILCRASSSFQYYENALDAAGVPYLTVAGKGFYDRPEIRDLLNALQAIADPYDDLALAGLLRSPACGVSDVTLYYVGQQRPAGVSWWQWLGRGVLVADEDEMGRVATAVALIRDLHQQAGRLPVADVLKQFLDRTHYRASLRRQGQPRALRNIGKLLIDIHNSGLVSVSEFLEYARSLRDSGSREGEARATGGGAVQIMSIHAAKGLEFPVVVLGDAGSVSRRAGGLLVDAQLGLLLPARDEVQVQAASYQLGANRAQEQEEAENARLLYVALTRAEQMLLVNGTFTLTQSGKSSIKGWLGQLAEIVGLTGADWGGYEEVGGKRLRFDCALPDTAVHTTIYEPQAAFPRLAVAEGAKEVAAERPSRPPLQEPLITDGESVRATAEDSQRVWQVIPTGQRPTAPAWLIGSLVHKALSLWRFPDAAFEEWVMARAREYGLVDARPLRHASTEVARLLRRLQQHALYGEVVAAEERLHEVPYSYEGDGRWQTGYIDLLYRHQGLWTLVDFKTDRVRDEAALQRLLVEQDYEQQVRRYGTAVQQLVGIRPDLVLVFLDVGQGVRLIRL
ncbi:MAG: UvrD-helicase domain-containing protein [Ardenticatenaceae bacterium]|nr:UvrD-helicase domain-containing protein [Ardenticatenaceae bacterium]